MKYVIKGIGGLAVIVIVLTTFAIIMNSTFFSPTYVDKVAEQTKFYDRLATDVPNLVTNSSISQVQAQILLKDDVNAATMQAKTKDFLAQMQAYYQADGKPPELDLRDIALAARNQGIALPPDSALDKPVTLNVAAARPVGAMSRRLPVVGSVLAVILLALLALLSRGWHRFTVPAKTLVTSGVVVIAFWLVFKFMPSAFAAMLKNQVTNAFAPDLLVLLKAICADVAHRFLKAAIGLAASGGVLVLVGLGFKLAGHKPGKNDDDGVNRPTPFSRPTL